MPKGGFDATDSGGLEITIIDDNGDERTFTFEAPPGGGQTWIVNSDGTYSVTTDDGQGNTTTVTIDPSGGATAPGK